MICGGNVTVYFQYISHLEHSFHTFMNHLRFLSDQNETCWLLTEISERTQGNMGLYGIKSGLLGLNNVANYVKLALDGRTQIIPIDGKEYYAEEIIHAGNVYVFGGGHVAQELVPMLSHVGFRCIVADDRPEFASNKLFPDAERIVLVDFTEIEKHIQLTENDAVCVMTRGHAYDTIVQLQVLKKPIFYIGVIGSMQKIASVAKVLREHGFSEDTISSIHTPIGLAIKAETPAEIAVSITAELILERAKKFENG
jgi:xanthine dehydrogenase accessory factor